MGNCDSNTNVIQVPTPDMQLKKADEFYQIALAVSKCSKLRLFYPKKPIDYYKDALVIYEKYYPGSLKMERTLYHMGEIYEKSNPKKSLDF